MCTFTRDSYLRLQLIVKPSLSYKLRVITADVPLAHLVKEFLYPVTGDVALKMRSLSILFLLFFKTKEAVH